MPTALAKLRGETIVTITIKVQKNRKTIKTIEKKVSLLPVNISIIHPATGVLSEYRENNRHGGYISIKRGFGRGGRDRSPLTKLKIHKIDGVGTENSKIRLKFNSESRYKIYKDEKRTQLVTSETTEFPANAETTLYFQGEKKSKSLGGEEITMQVKVNDKWIDGDKLKCTVVQSEFPIDLRIFIPYNWVNIPHPIHPRSIAKGDNRGFDPTLKGSYRIAQCVIVNPYRDLSSKRIRKPYKDVGKTEHYDINDVFNYKFRSKHSEDPSVKPSYIKPGAKPTESGVANLGRVSATLVPGSSSYKRTVIKFKGAASEPLVSFAADIDWEFSVDIIVDNPLEPKYSFAGKHDGFPAYEIYINANYPTFPVTTVLQWKPPLESSVTELMGSPDATMLRVDNQKIEQSKK